MKINRGQIQVFSISFIDILSCALGAVIILFVVVPKSPATPELEQKVLQRLQVINQSLKSENQSLKKELESRPVQKKSVIQKAIPIPAKKPEATLFGLPLKADHAAFVIDVSGSMVWQVKNLYHTVESLLLSSDVEKFRFIYFDENIYSSGNYWRHGWFPGTASNKDLVLRQAERDLEYLINSPPASTNSGDALYKAISFADTDVIYFITDGYPTAGETNTERILRRVKQMNRRGAIINSIMVGLPGTGINNQGIVVFDSNAKPKLLYDFLHKLAEQNGGVYVGR